MGITAVIDRVLGVWAVRADSSADRVALEGGLRSITVVRSWLASAEADLSSRLAGCASFPEQAIAEAGRGSQHEAFRVLVGVATHGSVSDFRKRLKREAESLRADDGKERFERQEKAARLRRWTDADGMWCLSGRFDPLTGVRLNARLQAEIEAAFAESVPEGCPTDPQAKSEFLAACALARIMEDAGVAQRAGRAEFVVVIEVDVDQESTDAPDSAEPPHDTKPDVRRPRVDWGLPVEIPWSVLIELFGDSDAHPVIVRNGVVLYAPGELNLGRTTRLANRAQRRALRALYATCGIPGCGTSFDRCKIHHIVWWRHAGRTDLENLLPLCVHHHTLVHRDGWVITLGPGRTLTLRLPDGTVHNTGPPGRRAA